MKKIEKLSLRNPSNIILRNALNELINSHNELIDSLCYVHKGINKKAKKIEVERYFGMQDYLESRGVEKFKNANIEFKIHPGGYGEAEIIINTKDRHIIIDEDF